MRHKVDNDDRNAPKKPGLLGRKRNTENERGNEARGQGSQQGRYMDARTRLIIFLHINEISFESARLYLYKNNHSANLIVRNHNKGAGAAGKGGVHSYPLSHTDLLSGGRGIRRVSDGGCPGRRCS